MLLQGIFISVILVLTKVYFSPLVPIGKPPMDRVRTGYTYLNETVEQSVLITEIYTFAYRFRILQQNLAINHKQKSYFNLARASCLVSVFVSLARSLATKFLHLRSAKFKSRTRDPVPTLIIRTRTLWFLSKIYYKSIFFLITIISSDTSEI